jgi:hypothetical protein
MVVIVVNVSMEKGRGTVAVTAERSVIQEISARYRASIDRTVILKVT